MYPLLCPKPRLQPWILLALAAAGCGPAGSGASNLTGESEHTDATLGIRFAYPDSFLVGRFAIDSLPADLIAQGVVPPFQHAVVLVQPETLGDHPLSAVPIGDVPVIWVDRSTTAELIGKVFAPEWERDVAGKRVVRYPGFPGPYGDYAYYYLVTFPNGTVIEVGGHRYRMTDPEGVESGYDTVMEGIIGTLELLP